MQPVMTGTSPRLLLVVALTGCWRGPSASPAVQGTDPPVASPVPSAGAARVAAVEPALTASLVLETITMSYLGELRRCYTSRLKQDQRAGGRVIVTLTIDRNGAVDGRRANGAGRQIEKCVERAMARWTFPPPRSTDGRPTKATFRIALLLSSA